MTCINNNTWICSRIIYRSYEHTFQPTSSVRKDIRDSEYYVFKSFPKKEVSFFWIYFRN